MFKILKAFTMFKIDKNVPPPSQNKYPFDEMEPGDSFHVSGDVQINRARVAMNAYVKKTKKKFTSRKDETGLRIWYLGKK